MSEGNMQEGALARHDSLGKFWAQRKLSNAAPLSRDAFKIDNIKFQSLGAGRAREAQNREQKSYIKLPGAAQAALQAIHLTRLPQAQVLGAQDARESTLGLLSAQEKVQTRNRHLNAATQKQHHF